jgi:hypothetical protein
MHLCAGAFGRAPTFGRVGLYHAAEDGRVTEPPAASRPFGKRSLTRSKRRRRQLMPSRGTRCELAGGALWEPRDLNLPGVRCGNRHVLPPRRMRRPIPAY